MRGLIVCLAFVALPAGAQVFKCTEGGRIVFSDYPCQRTDNKTIDVRPATGGPVNRSSEYWDEQKRREEKAAADERAEWEREANERWKHKEQIAREREAMFAKFTPGSKYGCAYSLSEKVAAKKMDELFGQYLSTSEVALTSPRIALAGPRIRLAELETSILRIPFQTACLMNLQLNARGFMTSIGSALREIAAGADRADEDVENAGRFLGNYMKGRVMYRVSN